MGRRRRWSDDEKLRIVLESLSGPRLVSVTARRHRISRSLLVIWRRVFLAEQRQAGSVPGFVPAMIVPEPTHASSLQAKPYSEPARSCEGRIEIVFVSGRRVVIDPDVDPEALARVINVVDRR